MSIFIELFVSKKFLARKGEKTLETQPSKTCLDAKFRYNEKTLNPKLDLGLQATKSAHLSAHPKSSRPKPFLHHSGILRIPFMWSDDTHILYK